MKISLKNIVAFALLHIAAINFAHEEVPTAENTFKNSVENAINVITANYKNDDLPAIFQACTVIKQAPQKAWLCAAQMIIQITTLPVYKIACEKPNDIFYWNELKTQATMYCVIIAPQQTDGGFDSETYQTANIIVSLYLMLLQLNLANNAVARAN